VRTKVLTEVVEIRSFADEASAWLARAVLEANGIAAEVIGFQGPNALPAPRVRLAVRAEDAPDALRLLAGERGGPSA
jgi:hypothetical protein